jgi:hypothetical protein
MTMLRYVTLGLAATPFLGTTLIADNALAHHGGYWHGAIRRGAALIASDPRAGRAGYYGGHYGTECYRAANGRTICPDRY